jgi:hypothetical protein
MGICMIPCSEFSKESCAITMRSHHCASSHGLWSVWVRAKASFSLMFSLSFWRAKVSFFAEASLPSPSTEFGEAL